MPHDQGYSFLEVAEAVQRATDLLGHIPDDDPHRETYEQLFSVARFLRDKYDKDQEMPMLDENIRLLRRAKTLCPLSASRRDEVVHCLADGLHQRYHRQGSVEDIEECVELNREVLALRPRDHSNREISLIALAHALDLRYDQLQNDGDLDQYIELMKEALDHRPPSHPSRADLLNDAAAALCCRYNRFEREEDLEQWLEFCKEVLTLRPPGHALRALSLHNLALAHFNRHDQLGKIEDLDTCIELRREALDLHPPGHPKRDESLENLADACHRRYHQSEMEDDLQQLFELSKELLEFHPPGHSQRLRSVIRLSDALKHRYKVFHKVDDLDRCTELSKEALELCPPEHFARDHALENLANMLQVHYHQSGKEKDLQRCIELRREALELCPSDHPSRSHDNLLNDLALALGHAYDRFGNEEDLQVSVELYRQALSMCPPGQPSRSAALNNIASALDARYNRFGREEDLQQCIIMRREVVKLCPPGHERHVDALNSFATTLCRRYHRFRKEEDLQHWIELSTEALVLSAANDASRRSAFGNLACALHQRYDHFGNEDDLRQSLDLSKAALELYPPGHPSRENSLISYSIALDHLYDLSGNEEDLHHCIMLYREALVLCPPGHHNRSTSIHRLAGGLSHRYTHFGREEDLEEALTLLKLDLDNCLNEADKLDYELRWVSFAEKHGHDSLGEAFDRATACLQWYLSIGPTAQLQYEVLLRKNEITTLPTSAAAYFISLEKVEEAVELLDEGRGLLMAEMRRFRQSLIAADQAKLGELAKQYVELCEELRNLSSAEIKPDGFLAAQTTAPVGGKAIAYCELLKKKRAKIKDHEALILKIRQIPGCEDFQGRPKFAKLQAAAKDGPIVVINCSKRRSDIIIILHSGEPLLVPLEEGFYERMLVVYKHYAARMADLGKRENTARAISAVLEPVAKKLWDSVVRHAVQALQANGVPRGSRIWWCPTSFLASMPLHAAGYGSDWLIDYVSSYTPTLSALISARQAATQEPSLPRILVVAQTKTSGLKNAAPELEEMQKSPFFQHYIDEEAATPESVGVHLPAYNWAHFICHGTVSDNPSDSHLHLHNGSKLTLNDIIKLHLKDAKFAFLAACHSAEQSREETVLKDEVLHLAAAMQVSGFQGVIGTMWQMEDSDGPDVARMFYTEMLKGECAEEAHVGAARALWKTVRWLKRGMLERDTRHDMKEKEQSLEQRGRGKRRACQSQDGQIIFILVSDVPLQSIDDS